MTRRAVLDVAAAIGYEVVERTVSLAEALDADEAFVTASSSYVEAVATIDGRPIGSGAPGPVTTRVRAAYLAYARDSVVRPPIT